MDDPSEPLRRRDVLRGMAGCVSLPLFGCEEKEPTSCLDAPGADDKVRQEREALGYQDIGADRARACKICRHWVPASELGACASCKVMKGPVHPRGTCRVFVVSG